ncbi:uncharacterized protein LOC108599379 [Drosophila busckii]|uniref:uncharacterized protein LOC108599379 n=1 Tax=Drosophila busckii TaxID=30019 RepID=UPI00083EDBE8|nr:uncharacterized protein LOC108599379 [Drosophila busckii]
MQRLILCCVLLSLALCQASYIPATPPLSHQFVLRNYNGYYVPPAWPTVATYPSYVYGYYPYNYNYNYNNYGYGYGYKSVW